MLKARFVLSTCFVLALLGAGWCAATFAGKPPPPPPPPAPGKITFAVESKGFFQMNGDGSGKTAVPFTYTEGSPPVPSLGSYNGHRWWLSILDSDLVPNQTDLYASKDGSHWIQLTASSISPHANGTETHVRFFADPCWSSSIHGDDQFCSVKATYYDYNPATGAGSNIHRIIYALDISAGELEAIAAGAPFTPLSVTVADDGSVAGDGVHPVISAAVPISPGVEPLVEHNWSWDGTRITFVRNNASPGALKDLYVADVSHGPVDAANASLIYHNPSNFDVARPRWTPPGNMLADELIAFDCGAAIYTVLPHPNEIAHMVTNNGYGAFWSPDGKYIAYQVPVYFVHGWTRSYDIVRIPSGGGTILTLSADSLGKNLWGWGE